MKAYTNAGPATLLLNGVELGAQAPQGRILRWNVRLRPGANRIEVRSASGLSDVIEWTFRRAPGMLTPTR